MSALPSEYIARKTPTTATLELIPSGKAGIIETLKIMSRLTKEGKKTLAIRQTALSLVNGANQKDWLEEVSRLFEFVRDRIRYVKDIKDVETLQTPDKTLEFQQGDCDDKSVLLASLLESIGHPTRFIAIGFAPNVYVHVYVETKIGNKWVALETTEPVPLGWSAPGVVAKLIYFN